MAAWAWLKYAPWGEIAKAAARVPDLVRDMRKPREAVEEAQRAEPPADAGADVSQLRFEIEILKANLDRLRTHSEAQARAMEEQSRVLSESFETISRRLRFTSWIAVLAILASVIALMAVLLR